MLIEQKLTQLTDHLRSLKTGLIALSGGVDSCLLLVIATEIAELSIQAATIASPAHPDREIERAIELARQYQVPHHLIRVDETENPFVKQNGSRRCYFCKLEKYNRLIKLSEYLGLNHVLDGSNADDLQDHRPGLEAIRELQIKIPLAGAGLTKQEIRNIARVKNLPTWNAPASACLYTRVPSGEPLEMNRIKRIGAGENILIDAGFLGVRVRDHGQVARIEFFPEDLVRFLTSPEKTRLIQQLKELGYTYVSVDAEGYRKGSMNGSN